MRILSFVDVHANRAALRRIAAKAKRADVIVCAGDLSMFGNGLRRSLQMLHQTGKPVLVIPGNHETEDELAAASRGLTKIVLLHGGMVQKGDVVFLGYGGGGFSFIDDGLEAYVRKMKQRIPREKKLVFVTHAPPYRTPLDYLEWLQEHRGCKSTMKMIKILHPELVICGHFHETARMSCVVGKTPVINPGCYGTITEI